jgi:hypothetical protein
VAASATVTPASAAAIARPLTFTSPHVSHHSEPGVRQRCVSLPACVRSRQDVSGLGDDLAGPPGAETAGRQQIVEAAAVRPFGDHDAGAPGPVIGVEDLD